jgi:hypothetical protein
MSAELGKRQFRFKVIGGSRLSNPSVRARGDPRERRPHPFITSRLGVPVVDPRPRYPVIRLLRCVVVVAAVFISAIPVVAASDSYAGPPGPSKSKTLSHPVKQEVDQADRPTSVNQVRPPDGKLWVARWGPKDRSAYIEVSVTDRKISIPAIYRGKQPHRTTGQMLYYVLKEMAAQKPGSEFDRPTRITIDWITNERMLAELNSGMPAGKTLMGKTLARAVEMLGGDITGWDPVNRPQKMQSITAHVSYPNHGVGSPIGPRTEPGSTDAVS